MLEEESEDPEDFSQPMHSGKDAKIPPCLSHHRAAYFPLGAPSEGNAVTESVLASP